MKLKNWTLTWKVNGNAVEWYLNGGYIERTKVGKSCVLFGLNLDVVKAIRRYHPDVADYATAKGVWDRREQDKTDALYGHPLKGEPANWAEATGRG